MCKLLKILTIESHMAMDSHPLSKSILYLNISHFINVGEGSTCKFQVRQWNITSMFHRTNLEFPYDTLLGCQSEVKADNHHLPTICEKDENR